MKLIIFLKISGHHIVGEEGNKKGTLAAIVGWHYFFISYKCFDTLSNIISNFIYYE